MTGPGNPGAGGSAATLPGTVAPGSQPGFLLDLARCVGCGACVLACRLENQLPAGVAWRRIVSVNLPRHGGGPTWHLSLACHHCAHPPCRDACPTGALEKGPDGVVRLHAERCMGCRYCEMACPFGAPAFDAATGIMTKCHLCHPRLDRGLAPACVAACPTGALAYLPQVSGEDGALRSGLKEAGASRGARPAPELPGFSDPAGAEPALRLQPPAGALRSRAFEALEKALARMEEGP